MQSNESKSVKGEFYTLFLDTSDKNKNPGRCQQNGLLGDLYNISGRITPFFLTDS